MTDINIFSNIVVIVLYFSCLSYSLLLLRFRTCLFTATGLLESPQMADLLCGNSPKLSEMTFRKFCISPICICDPHQRSGSFRGNIVLCVVPSQDMEPLHSVKWHPQNSQNQ